MNKSLRCFLALIVLGASLLCLMPETPGFAQSYSIRPTCKPNGQCKVNTATFGFNDTNWRQWPMQPRPEERDSRTIGGTDLPTPPPILEQQLPHAESLPAKPPLSDGSGGGSILPLPGSTPGTTTIDGSTTTGPSSRPAGQNLQVPVPQGMPGIPEVDLAPRQPGSKPKTDGNGVEPLIPPKDLSLPGGSAPEILTPTPGRPAAEPLKTPNQEVPAPKSSLLPPDLTPLPALKPTELLPDKPKGSSLLPHGKNAVAARATAIPSELPMQANWDASLEPEAMSDNLLRRTSFEQRTSEKGNPLRSALEGYCPVQLRENDRWVAGNPNYQRSYQGQVFHFSSDAARKRFEAAPEKYAPVQGGNDIVLTVEENRTVPGSVSHSALLHGQLYLFSSSTTLNTFQENPARYANAARQAALQHE